MAQSSINLNRIEDRSRLQYFIAPFKSLFVAMLITIIYLFSSSSFLAHGNNAAIDYNNLENNSSSIEQQQIHNGNHAAVNYNHPGNNSSSLEQQQIHKAKNKFKEQELARTPISDNLELFELTALLFCLTSIFALILLLFVVSFCHGLVAFSVLLFTKSYPKWVYEWNQGVLKYNINLIAYNWLIIPELPKLDGSNHGLEISIAEPKELSRWLPFVKWLITMPQAILVSIMFIVFGLLNQLLWIYLVLTGKAYPKKVEAHIIGFLEWYVDIVSYKNIFVTDRYPKFLYKKKS